MRKILLVFISLIVIFFMYREFQKSKTSSQPSNPTITSSSPQATAPIRMSFGDKRINEETPTYDIHVVYPEIAGIPTSAIQAQINTSLKDYIEKTVQEFKKEIELINDTPVGQKSTLIVDYDLVQLSSQMISLKFNISNYTAGAAHPNNFVHPWSYDLVNQRQISGLEDVFDPEKDSLALLSEISRTELKAKFQNDWSGLESTVLSGTEPKQENFAEFSLARNTLNIYFNPYQVAPYAVGVVEVKIPYEQLQSVLRSDFILNPR